MYVCMISSIVEMNASGYMNACMCDGMNDVLLHTSVCFFYDFLFFFFNYDVVINIL